MPLISIFVTFLSFKVTLIKAVIFGDIQHSKSVIKGLSCIKVIGILDKDQ